MQDKNILQTAQDIAALSNELTYHRYLFDKDKVKSFFTKLSIPEYVALHSIAATGEKSGAHPGRTYLKDLAEKMQLTIRRTSKLVGALKDRGLLLWSHDGNGSEGTYVSITESGLALLEEHENILKEYYGRVIEKFGKDNIIQLLRMMNELESVMDIEIEEMGASGSNDGIDE